MPRERNPETDNHNFVQVSRQFLADWRRLLKRSPIAIDLMYLLMQYMGRTTNAVVISQKSLCELTGYSRQYISRGLRVLKEERWVEVVKVGTANAYCVNEKIAWQAARNQREYALFSAAVYASNSEQDEEYRELSKQELRHIPFVETKGERMIVDDQERLPPPDQLDMSHA